VGTSGQDQVSASSESGEIGRDDDDEPITTGAFTTADTGSASTTDAGEGESESGRGESGESESGEGESGEYPANRPNILLIVADDLGYSDIGAFGGEIHTPNLDKLAAHGRILTEHHSGFTCAPTRSMLISGTDHHLVGLGRMGAGTGPQAGQPGYEGYLNDRALSIAELLRDADYHTYIAGKWHLGSEDHQTPLHRGYESSYVLLPGVSTHFNEFSDPPTEAESRLYRENGEYVVPPADFFSTDFYTDRLISYIEANRGDGKPFYAFAAYTAPHWPLQAPEEYLDRYRGVYDVGYDVIRERRLKKLRKLGIIPQAWEPNPGLPAADNRPTWDDLSEEERRYEARRMEIYAAMVENLDANVGKLVKYLKDVGEYDNTFIFFQSDNGAEGGARDRANADNSLENLGYPGSYIGVGLRWAEVSATPFRLYKSYSAEGGHSVPAIARLPEQYRKLPHYNGLTHLTDLAPTFLELAGVPDPGDEYRGRPVHPISGISLLPTLEGRASDVRSETDVLADEQSNHRYVIRGRWKLLWLEPPFGQDPPAWELFDLEVDRGETNNVAAEHPDIVAELLLEWDRYVQRNGVILTSTVQPGGGGR